MSLLCGILISTTLLHVGLCQLKPFQIQKETSMLSFQPKTLLVSDAKPDGTVFIRCKHPNKGGARKYYNLKISRRSLSEIKYDCFVESSVVCKNINYTCPGNKSICTPLSRDSTTSFSGNYNSVLVAKLSNASCLDADFRYRCYSVYNKQSDAATDLTYSEHYDQFFVGLDTPRPTMTVKLLQSSAETQVDFMGIGDELELTCRAGIQLMTDKEKDTSSWVWEMSDGSGPWNAVGGSKDSTHLKGCVVSGTSTYTARIAAGETCVRRFRCFVVYKQDRMDKEAVQHAVVVSNCGKIDTTAVAIAILGTAIAISGVVILSVAILIRKRRSEKMYMESKSPQPPDLKPKTSLSFEPPIESSRQTTTVPLVTVSDTSTYPPEANKGGQWPLPVDDYQKRWDDPSYQRGTTVDR